MPSSRLARSGAARRRGWGARLTSGVPSPSQRYLVCSLNPPQNASVLSVDEKTQIQVLVPPTAGRRPTCSSATTRGTFATALAQLAKLTGNLAGTLPKPKRQVVKLVGGIASGGGEIRTPEGFRPWRFSRPLP